MEPGSRRNRGSLGLLWGFGDPKCATSNCFKLDGQFLWLENWMVRPLEFALEDWEIRHLLLPNNSCWKLLMHVHILQFKGGASPLLHLLRSIWCVVRKRTSCDL